MPGFPEILVGYRARDPRRAAFADVYGGRCVDCGAQTWFNASAIEILAGAEHDATIVCDWCYQTNRAYIDAAMV